MLLILLTSVGIAVVALITAVIIIKKIHRKSIQAYIRQIEEMAADSEKQGKELRVVSERLASIAVQLADTIEESNAFSKSMMDLSLELEKNNGKMLSSSSRSIFEVRKMTGLLDRMTGMTSSMKKASLDANMTISGSLKDISAIIDAVELINITSSQTAQKVEDVQSTSNQIIQILDTVRDISERTQLLAFNAAIESARAGDTGRGFAVVSDEIRKLSGATGEAVESIGGLVSSILAQVESLHDVSAKNRQSAVDGAASVKIVEKRLGDITLSFEGTLTGIDSISKLALEQDDMASSIGKSVSVLEEDIRSADGSVEKVHAAVERQHSEIMGLTDMAKRLNEAAEEMREMTSYLKAETITGGSVSEKIIDSARYAVKRGILREISLLPTTGEAHGEAVDEFLKRNSVFEAAWTNDVRGRFICSVPPSGIANAMNREWFRHAVAGEEYVSEPYLSAITGEPCVTFSFPLAGTDGKIFGVAGFDISVNRRQG